MEGKTTSLLSVTKDESGFVNINCVSFFSPLISDLSLT
ncbi:hypothetical protein ZORO111903_08225 [Zobellia roscoffensis]